MPIQLSSFPFVLAIAAGASAQAPAPAELAQKAHSLAQQLGELGDVDKPNDAQKAQLAATRKELAEFVAACTKGDGFTAEHFVEASSPLLENNHAEALAIAAAGTARFPESRFLHDHTGFAHTGLANAAPPSAAQVASLRAAEAAFRKALQYKPDTWHAHAGLYQVLDQLGECDEALRELDTVVKDAEGRAAINLPVQRRASLLMRGGKAKEAVAVLKAATPEANEKLDLQVLLLRAMALSGDAAGTQAAATALRAMEASPRTLLDAADALAYVGKKPDALKLLAQRPPRGKFESEEEREAQLYSQSGEAMEAFLKATDYSPTGPLRAALTKALDHHFMFAGAGAAKPTDFATSPLMMAKLLGGSNMPAEPIKDWGNHTLFVLSMRAVPGYKPTPPEQQLADLLKKDRWPTADDIPGRLLALRCNVGDPSAAGALTGLRAVEKLDAKAPAPPAKK